jgi:N-formylmaleamate deformylase
MKAVATLIVNFLLSIFILQAQGNTKPAYTFGVRIMGKGTPMLLIPGFKGSADTYNQVVEHYKQHYKC